MATDQRTAENTGNPAPPAAPAAKPRMSRRALLTCFSVAGVLVAWFFFAWLALHRHVIDAAGESIGSGFALLLVISIVGAMRSRPGPPS